MKTPITTDSYTLIAARAYQKRLCLSTQAFFNDMTHLEIKGDLTRYFNTQDPRLIRILINKLIIAKNLFGPDSVELVLFRLEGTYLTLAKHLYRKLGILAEDFVEDTETQRKINEAVSKV